ncbi:MAG TPA: ATP-binding protein, partial [Halalkalibaculum sp.]|nr:ATP-binding protein [Halalkalibaculum sp.]
IEDINLDIDQAIPCGLLINEIVVNAFKHGFENKDKGSIEIAMKKQNGDARLVIADDGHGIPEDFDISKSSSLGMMLIETFKNQLDASLHISNSRGTRFTFSFPIN